MNLAGEVGAAWSYEGGQPRMSVRTASGLDIYSGTNFNAGG
jgi:hypothetical protein